MWYFYKYFDMIIKLVCVLLNKIIKLYLKSNIVLIIILFDDIFVTKEKSIRTGRQIFLLNKVCVYIFDQSAQFFNQMKNH